MSVPRRLALAARLLAFAHLVCVPAALAQATKTEAAKPSPFLVKPYLQIGDAAPGTLRLLWQTSEADGDWSVAYQPEAGKPWRTADAPEARTIAVAGVAPHRMFHATLKDLPPGSTFPYRVSRRGDVVFEAEAKARKGADQPFRFVAFGDCGANTVEENAIAYRAYLAAPDLVVIPGDIVYSRGRISEYRRNYWPTYNADRASYKTGAPLMRSTLFVAAPGNHDVATRDLDAYPDGLAYFHLWDQPRNGPVGKEGGPLVPPLTGSDGNKKAFFDASGPAYPRMANFSFDYGNAHWTVLDSNPYVDWTDPELRSWVAADLASAKGSAWRFVAFHHPGFNSSKAHFEAQMMRPLSDVFEAGKVDVVFNGHVHNYQRTFPMRFAADRRPDGKVAFDNQKVAGRWTLDKSFDGRTDTRPDGVIYVITGAGGQSLYNPEQQDDPAGWQPFTNKYAAKVHSLTVADVSGRTLTVRQLTAHGDSLDDFTITK